MCLTESRCKGLRDCCDASELEQDLDSGGRRDSFGELVLGTIRMFEIFQTDSNDLHAKIVSLTCESSLNAEIVVHECEMMTLYALST